MIGFVHSEVTAMGTKINVAIARPRLTDLAYRLSEGEKGYRILREK